ncbi:uncharacterized protein TA04710 [Theileria annulata]|uniref:Uncharacterized protein n=1 Tax=Theileria annulata TaxID=5874 RepID=Q4UBW6_THEAN|nr:uncharacterized protein TA04710 [Theileria annulata]CAI75685.1 hypothetical protein TA04710 [Theileria annulata]|eukprot:XP_955161.1 hypothetical protein TA04710 [Theileria annulata]
MKVEYISLKCDTVDKCSFFCQTAEKDYNVNGSRKVGRTIERVLSKNGDIIPKSSINWLCSGDKWNSLFVKKGWITGVKGDFIRKMNPMFQFFMNTYAECGGGDLLDSAKNLSVKSSSEMLVVHRTNFFRCKSMKNCDFFTHAFIIDEKFMSFSTLTNFCKGPPLNLAAKDGNLLGILTEVDKEASEKGERISEATAKPMYYYGGPITSDHYYDDLRRGSIVPATNL